jgi:large subunit ribosomal protein L9
MEIILREDVRELGKAGEVVKVKDGYARNYLLPHGLAYAATEANKRKIAFEATRIAKQRAGEREAAEQEASRLVEIRLTFAAKVGEEDRLYGSVTAGDIQRKLQDAGIQVDKRKIDLPEPIRALGEFPVGIRLHPEVRPEITVIVVREDEAA